MGMIQLPDELQRLIEREVAEGHAASAAAFLEEAVIRLVQEFHADDHDLPTLVQDGIADLDAGRFITIATPDDGHRLLADMMAEAAESAAAKR
jgi:Arc/MetJ-type ribon-helix-helix transcriptional regulator